MSEPDDIRLPEEEPVEQAPSEDGEADRELRHWFFSLVAFLVILMVGVAAGGVVSLRALITEEEDARLAWARVSEVQDTRRQLLDDVIRMEGWLAEPPALVRRYRAALEAADTAGDFDQEVEALEALDALTAEMIGLVGRRARADTSSALVVLYGRLEGSERLLVIEGERYNEAAARYCDRLDRIPTRWIGRVFGFRDLRQYSAGDSG